MWPTNSLKSFPSPFPDTQVIVPTLLANSFPHLINSNFTCILYQQASLPMLRACDEVFFFLVVVAKIFF